jgi:hypothetical protein
VEIYKRRLNFFLVAAAESSDRREIYFTTLTVMWRHWDSSAQAASELSSCGRFFKTASKAATIYCHKAQNCEQISESQARGKKRENAYALVDTLGTKFPK